MPPSFRLGAETGPLNQLLAPFGITYNADATFTNSDCPPPNVCYCAYGSIPFDAWLTDAVADITKNLKTVGVFMGRSITCSGANCKVIATDNVDTSAVSKTVGVAEQVGNGRVFAWGDEWVTYTSQWGLTPDTSPSAYDDPNKSPQCVDHTPHTSYTVPQFWYNVFRWVVQTSCLTIVVPPTAGSVTQIIY